MKRAALSLIAAALLALAAPAAASAADYRGKTNQGLKVSAHVKDGRLKLLKINWRASCDNDGYSRSRTDWEDMPDGPIEHDGSKFTDSGVQDIRTDDGRTKMTLKLAGEILADRITGKSTVRLKFYTPKGRLVTSCRGTFFFDIPKV